MFKLPSWTRAYYPFGKGCECFTKKEIQSTKLVFGFDYGGEILGRGTYLPSYRSHFNELCFARSVADCAGRGVGKSVGTSPSQSSSSGGRRGGHGIGDAVQTGRPAVES